MSSFDAFLKLDDVTGDSKDSAHKDWIQLASYNFGATNAGSAAYGGGMGTGKVAMQDFHFTPKNDSASPLLFLRCCDGKHIGKGILELQKTAGDKPLVFFRVTFTDLVVSSFQTSGGDGMAVPNVAVSFNFSKIMMDSVEQKQDGSAGKTVTHGWDVKQNVKA